MVARKSIETALGKLEVILALEPKATNIPVYVSAEINSLVTDIENLRSIKEEVTKAVEIGDMQMARKLLENLKSEISLETVNVPLGSHGNALREAVRLINKGDLVTAHELLRVAMNTLVVVKRTIPVPLLNSELLVDESAKVLESDPDSAIGMLNEARIQIEISELLGYGYVATTEYSRLYADIMELEKKIVENKDSNDLYEKLAQTIGALRIEISK